MNKALHLNIACDPLSEIPASLHNSVSAIEMHGAKYMGYKNNFTHVLIA